MRAAQSIGRGGPEARDLGDTTDRSLARVGVAERRRTPKTTGETGPTHELRGKPEGFGTGIATPDGADR